MIKSQEDSALLERLFNPEDKTIRIDLAVLKEICSSEDYHKLIDLTFILTKLFLAGKQKLSIRELIGKTVHSEGKDKEDKIDFFVDCLSGNELSTIAKELFQIRKKLKHTIYSSRLYSVIEFLLKIYEEFNPQIDKKTDGLSNMCIGDFQILEQEYKKAQSNNQLQFSQVQQSSKIFDLLKSPRSLLQGRFSNLMTLQKFISKEIFPYLQRSILIIPLSSHTERESQISRVLKFINQHFIGQYKMDVEISKNTLVQTRTYTNKLYKELISRTYHDLLKTVHKIINQAILCPSSIHIQLLTLRILRRIYLLEESCTHSSETIEHFRSSDIVFASSPASTVKNALYLVLRNISLFSEGHDEEMKEAAMLCYKIVNQKSDLELASMIDGNDDMRFLRNSKFYTSKAYIYSQQIEKVYDLSELGSLYLKMYQTIAPREIWVYTLLVEKPSSLVCWEFYLAGYDIRFGIFKIDELRDLTQEEYEKGIGCKQVFKIQKVQNLANNPCRGHIFLKNGIYRLVFDNSFSLMRSKDLFYSFLHLEYSS